MQERHKNRKKYFQEQVITTKKYVIPYLNQFIDTKNISILEIGCGEGGNLEPFLVQDCSVVGVDLAIDKIANGKVYLSDYIRSKSCVLHDIDVFKIDTLGDFDLIFFRDVIEHITDHEKLLVFTYNHLKPGGIAFIAFPPWQNPFGGHQQMLNSFLSKLPFIHLLNSKLYKKLLELTGEREDVIKELLELNDSKVTVEHFESLVSKTKFSFLDSRLYFINPNYEVKFKLKPIILNKYLAQIPILRNFLSTTCYALLKK